MHEKVKLSVPQEIEEEIMGGGGGAEEMTGCGTCMHCQEHLTAVYNSSDITGRYSFDSSCQGGFQSRKLFLRLKILEKDYGCF